MNLIDSPLYSKSRKTLAKFLSASNLFNQLLEYLLIVYFTHIRPGLTLGHIFLPLHKGEMRQAMKSSTYSESASFRYVFLMSVGTLSTNSWYILQSA